MCVSFFLLFTGCDDFSSVVLVLQAQRLLSRVLKPEPSSLCQGLTQHKATLIIGLTFGASRKNFRSSFLGIFTKQTAF